MNSGINLGIWRLRDQRTWQYHDSRSHASSQWQILKSYIGRNIIALRSALIIGKSNTDGDLFESFGFRGIQLSSDDDMHAEDLVDLVPVIRGVANSNAQVSVRQNGFTIYQTFVAPGKFIINDLVPISSNSDFEVVIKEADGSTQSFIVPYTSSPLLQRVGNLKYALTAGRFNSIGDHHHNPEFMQSTLAWGFSPTITLYGGAQHSTKYTAGAVGASYNLGRLGTLSTNITVAKSHLYDGSHHIGQSLHLLYSNSVNASGTTFQLSGNRYSMNGFYTLGESALKEMKGWHHNLDLADEYGSAINGFADSSYNLHNIKKSKIKATISQNVGELGSLYISAIRQTYWNTSGMSDSLQVGFNGSVSRANYSLSYRYNKEHHDVKQNRESEQSIYLSVSMPIFERHHQNTIYANYNVGRSHNSDISHQIGLTGTALKAGNLSWDISKSYGRGQNSHSDFSLNYLGEYGSRYMGYSHGGNYRQINYGAEGSIILLGNKITFDQPISEDSTLLAAPNYFNEMGQLGIKEDISGNNSRPYTSVNRETHNRFKSLRKNNAIGFNNNSAYLMSNKEAVMQTSFQGEIGRRVLMRLTYNKHPVPYGAMVKTSGRSSIVGDNGEVYLLGMDDEGTIKVQWENNECWASYILPAKDNNQFMQRITAVCK
nr:fimbria/pilus outer membrane usher protein [Providencia sneebia]